MKQKSGQFLRTILQLWEYNGYALCYMERCNCFQTDKHNPNDLKQVQRGSDEYRLIKRKMEKFEEYFKLYSKKHKYGTEYQEVIELIRGDHDLANSMKGQFIYEELMQNQQQFSQQMSYTLGVLTWNLAGESDVE